MSLGLHLILSTTLAAAPPTCQWAHPGANPYRGDPVRALGDFDLPSAARDKLRVLMRTHRPTDMAVITRDDIVGDAGSYVDLREMHSGHGRVCHGRVDRSAWSGRRRERARVYCVEDACVIVPLICHNVALVSRRHGPVAQDEGSIDIEPAAGPPHALQTPAPTPPELGPPGWPYAPNRGADLPAGPAGPGDGGGPCCDAGPGIPIAPGWPGAPSPPGAPGAPALPGLPQLPGSPGGPGVPPVTTPVPEPPAWLLLAGVAALWPWRRTAARRG